MVKIVLQQGGGLNVRVRYVCVTNLRVKKKLSCMKGGIFYHQCMFFLFIFRGSILYIIYTEDMDVIIHQDKFLNYASIPQEMKKALKKIVTLVNNIQSIFKLNN